MVETLLIYDPTSKVSLECKTKIEEISKMDIFSNVTFKECLPSDEEGSDNITKYKVNSIPTILIKNDNELLYKLIGNAPQQDIARLIEISLEKVTKK